MKSRIVHAVFPDV